MSRRNSSPRSHRGRDAEFVRCFVCHRRIGPGEPVVVPCSVPIDSLAGRTEAEVAAVLERLSPHELDALLAAFDMPTCTDCRDAMAVDDGESDDGE